MLSIHLSLNLYSNESGNIAQGSYGSVSEFPVGNSETHLNWLLANYLIRLFNGSLASDISFAGWNFVRKRPNEVIKFTFEIALSAWGLYWIFNRRSWNFYQLVFNLILLFRFAPRSAWLKKPMSIQARATCGQFRSCSRLTSVFPHATMCTPHLVAASLSGRPQLPPRVDAWTENHMDPGNWRLAAFKHLRLTHRDVHAFIGGCQMPFSMNYAPSRLIIKVSVRNL